MLIEVYNVYIGTRRAKAIYYALNSQYIGCNLVCLFVKTAIIRTRNSISRDPISMPLGERREFYN